MSSAGEKTEAPTPKRKREARREGRGVAKSQELSIWGTILLVSFVMPICFGLAGKAVRELFAQTGEVMSHPEVPEALGLLGAGGKAILLGSVPLAVSMLGFGLVVNLSQSGLVFSTKKLKPSTERLNIVKGVKRLFSPELAWQGAKVTLRTAALAVAAWFPLQNAVRRLGAADQPPLPALIAGVGGDAMRMLRTVAIAGLLLGAVDYLVQRRRINKNLRMTKQEVKEEFRQQEGDPMIRGQIRAKQREMSRNRMFAAVADASVVIVNPTHVAVALKYEAGSGAPRLVAKGKGHVATRIRQEAEKHRVPMVRDIPLARALHDTCPLDHPIPAELYAAVAKILAFVLTLGKKAAAMGGVVALPAGTAR